MTKKLQTFVCFLALLLCGAVNSMAQSQQQDFALVEQDGLYYTLYLSQKTAQIVQGAIAKYYIEHNGDMSGYDYNAQHEILPAYKGSVNVPASVFYQNETYKVTDINGLGGNPELTAVRVEAALTSLSLSGVPNLTSLELANTESLTSMYLSNTGLSSLYIPAKVTYVSLSQNSNLTNIEVSPENPTYMMYYGILCYKNNGNPPTQIIYVPEGMEGTLVIPEGIVYCNFSLTNCTKLTEVVIPSTLYDINTLLNGVKNIKITFSGDNPTYKYEDGFILSADGKNMIVALGSDAESLTIPDGVQSFSESIWAWSYNQKFPNLKILTLPASFNQQYFFSELNQYLPNLEQVIIKDGNKYYCNVNGMVMDISRSTILCVPCHFQGSLTIPEGTSAIGSRAFYNNQRLTSITLPNTVYVLDYEAFAFCPNLESVTLSDVSYKLSGNIFSGCSKLETVVIPQSVKALGTGMFQGCTSLKTITLPDVSTIPSNIFSGCRSLESITIPNTVTYIDNYAFSYCVKLKDIKFSENLSSIGSYVFQSDSALVNLTLPASVQKIGQAITRYCPQLEQIKVDPNNAYLCDIDGVIFSKDKKTLMHFPAGRKGSYTIPTGTEAIGSYAFYECDSLKQITIPDGLVSLQNYAFGYLPLTELDLPASVTKISTNYALYYLQSLKKLIIRTSEKLSPYNTISSVRPSSECAVYVNDNNFNDFQNYNYDNFIVMSISKPYGIGAVTKYIKGLSFKLLENELMTNDKTLVSITAGNSTAVKQDNGTYLIKGLKSNTSYNININYQVDGKAGSQSSLAYYTNSPSYKIEGTATQTTYTLKSAYFRKHSDITTGKPRKMSVTIKDKEYACKENGYVADVPIKITGMIPGTSLPVTFNIQYEDGEELTWNSSITTQGFNPSLIDYKVTPTTLRLNYTYKEIDAVPDSVLLVIYDQVKTGTYSTKTVYDTLRTSVKENLFTGLIPGKQYKVSAIYLKNKGTNRNNYSQINNYYSIINTFETPALTIITDTPKVPERGRAIVGATTNAGDGEGHVGFQWIKYNAPSTMKPYEAYGQVFNGTAQGQLKNLSQTYYKVRAFYDYIDGGTSTRIYANNGSDNGWITFDADEIGTFEPIIHTYDDVQPTNTTVQLKGVLFEGSENIIKQGFEYWETDNNVAARTVRRVSANREHQTIYITGDNLTAEITGLIPGTEYAYRAFAETASGVVYGEECAFKTNGERPTDTAIEEVVIENNEPKTFNVYSVSGAMVRHQATSLEGLPRGIYVVNKRKVFVK